MVLRMQRCAEAGALRFSIGVCCASPLMYPTSLEQHHMQHTTHCCCCCLLTADTARCWLLTGASKMRRWCCLCGTQQTCGRCLQSELLQGGWPQLLSISGLRVPAVLAAWRGILMSFSLSCWNCKSAAS